MAKPMRALLRRTLYGSSEPLICLEDPFDVLPRILAGRDVRTIIDAGANHGRIARRLRARFPKAHVHLFEANPAFAETLAALAADDPHVHPNLVAVGDHEGTITLNVTEDPGQSSLFEPNERLRGMLGEGMVRERVEVPLVTMDGWAERGGHDDVGLIKLDIQAGEVAALRGARRLLDTTVLAVYTEVFFNPMYEGGALHADIDRCLRESGFGLYGLYSPKADEHGMLKWADAIFVHRARLGW